jgi:PucR family transcriptional regulator, purine catabolism regulatory protein
MTDQSDSPGEDLTVGQLATDPDLRMRLLVEDGAASRPIRSVHTTDLAHPFRYVLPRELVLTNGLWVSEVTADEWVEEVTAAGAAAVGFGLSERHESVPEALVMVCRGNQLPLLEIPADLLFTRIGERVAGATQAGQDEWMRHQLVRTRQLVLALRRGEGYSGLLSVLYRETGLSAAFVSPSGQIYAHVGSLPNRETLRAALAARRSGHLPRTLSAEASLFTPPLSGPPPFMLLVARPLNVLSDEDLVLIEQIAAYATAEDDQRRQTASVRQLLAAELIRLALDEGLSQTTYVARLGSLGLEDEPLLVLATTPSAFASDEIETRFAGRAVTASVDSDMVTIIQGSTIELFCGWVDESAILKSVPDLAIGLGGFAEDATSFRERVVAARAALANARMLSAGERLVVRPTLDSAQLIRGFVSPEVAEAFRNRVIGPLRQWDAGHGTDLVRTARVFLEHDGRWRETARVLYVHHNTLKNRIDRIRLLTGLDTDRTADRADLWLALSLED